MAERERPEPERQREAPKRIAGAPREPPQSQLPGMPATPAQSRPRMPFLASAVVAGLALAAVVAYALQPAGTGDQPLSETAKAERVAAFQAKGRLALPEVNPTERSGAIAQMELPPADKAALERDLEAQKTALAWLTLWDDQVQDGDVVEITGAGFKRTVSLTKAPQQVAVPLGSDGQFLMKGIRDGGGGITVAVTAEGQTVPIPVLDTGQALSIGFTR